MPELQEYQAKRSFESTPEPADTRADTGKTLSFVIQKHDASHLHYDFRLENKGALVSWAVPKGPSLSPEDKRLAMMTEDHPYDYQYFEGVIPKGNYGAGNVIIWDRGTYEVAGHAGKPKAEQEKAFRHNLYQGKVSFIMRGEKIRGEYTLVKAPPHKGENSWLLIKKKDRYASAEDVTQRERSVVSGVTVDEAPELQAFNWHEFEDCIEKYELPKRGIKRPVEPMLATLTDEPFSDADWIYEIKWDGYRAIAETGAGKARIYSRRQQGFSQKYPRVIEELEKIKTDLVLDGEVVVLDSDGRPDFNALQNYDPKSDSALAYYVFDLLWLDGYALTGAPLRFRKKMLRKVLPASAVVRYSDHIEEAGEKFFEMVAARGMEGVMAKRADSSYLTGKRSKSWLKIKTHHRQEAVIGGFTEPRGSREDIGSLVLGVYRGDELVYIGHSGGGLSAGQRAKLRRQLEKIERKSSPFKTAPKTNAPAHWVKPELMAEVSFAEWTPGGHMRQPRIVGVRSDKPAVVVVHEKPVPKEAAAPDSFEFSHASKIFWPKLKLTKGDLINYYQLMADKMMPYLSDRPVSLLRHPNGVGGKSFFQKDMTRPLPEGMRTFARYSESNKKDIHYFVCGGLESLLYMAQLGCIEINPWNSRTRAPDSPDWLVLDLDPEGIGFEKVIETALVVKEMLDEIDVRSFPKTSGKTGIHIYLPMHAKYSYEQVKQFGEILARQTVRRLPKITSVERSPSKRQGKIYVDFLQNRLGQTLAAPYSVRPVEEASVSMTLDWSDIKKGLKPSDFTLQNVASIVTARKDPWASFFTAQVSIGDALTKIREKWNG